MDHFLPNKNMQSPTFTVDGSDLSAASLSARNSTSTSSNSSWSMEADPQLYPSDVSFWQDMTPYLCSSPTSPYKYPYDETPGATGNDDEFYAATERGPRRVRNKEASPEVILRRRAQNRASQRAYRDRKDRRVKELETELATLSASHEKLERDHSSLCSAHAALAAAEKAWIAEKRELLRSERGSLDHQDSSSSSRSSAHAHAHSSSGTDDAWSCEGRVAVPGQSASSLEMGPNGAFVVKVVICKRCFGEGAQVSGLSCASGGGRASPGRS